MVSLFSTPPSRDTLGSIFADALQFRLREFNSVVSRRLDGRLQPTDFSHVDLIGKALCLMIAEGHKLSRESTVDRILNDDVLVRLVCTWLTDLPPVESLSTCALL